VTGELDNKTSDAEIAEAIGAAEDIPDLLKSLIETSAANPGAAFAPEVLERLSVLKEENRAASEMRRSKLKDTDCRVTEHDKAIAEESGDSGKRGPTRAAMVLRMARAAGIRLSVDAGDLVLEAAAPPPVAILELLSRYKPDVIALLLSGRDGWSAEDWQVCFDERAAILEYDAGVPREWAEGFARLDGLAPPARMDAQRWRRLVDNAGLFKTTGLPRPRP
jgi:hypothetical protein